MSGDQTPTPESTPTPPREASGETIVSPGALPPGQALPTGRRQALRDLRRQLTEADLANPGVIKLIIDMLEQADAECDELRGYQQRYHDADKESAVLRERIAQRTSLDTAIDVFFGVGMAVGGAILTVVPSLPADLKTAGWIVGLGLLALSVAAKVVRARAR